MASNNSESSYTVSALQQQRLFVWYLYLEAIANLHKLVQLQFSQWVCPNSKNMEFRNQIMKLKSTQEKENLQQYMSTHLPMIIAVCKTFPHSLSHLIPTMGNM